MAVGHWRAINPGVIGSITVTGGVSAAQVRAVKSLNRSDSQADSASSILVTRSTVTRSTAKPQLTPLSIGSVYGSALARSPPVQLTCNWLAGTGTLGDIVAKGMRSTGSPRRFQRPSTSCWKEQVASL